MIPLAKWLRDDVAPPTAGMMDGFGGMEAAPDQDLSARHEAEIEEAYQRGRAEAAAEAGHAQAEAMAEHEARASAREVEIAAEWTAKFSEQLVGSIQSSFVEMRGSLEAALEAALANLMSNEVRRKIATSLVQIIDTEISAAGRLPVEIGAPEHLHEQILAQCETRGLSLSLTDSPEIKVVFRDGLLRYDDMSKQWDDAIRGTTS